MIEELEHLYRVFRRRQGSEVGASQTPGPGRAFPPGLPAVQGELSRAFGGSEDLVMRAMHGDSLLIAFLDNMVDKRQLNEDVILPLLRYAAGENGGSTKGGPRYLDFLEQSLLTVGKIRRLDDFNACIDGILQGELLLFVEGSVTALSIGIEQWSRRSIEEPKSENVIRGPREGFTESIRDNIMLIRRRIRDTNLTFESRILGRQTKTTVSFCYIRGVADEGVLKEVRSRLDAIRTAAVLESGNIGEYIEDAPFSIFPTVGSTERPDTVAALVLEGRVAILCDGTPFVITVPHLFVEYLQTSEDNYIRWIYTPLLRVIRLIAMLASTTVPAFYVTFVCFHQDVIPFRLMMTIAAASEDVPFPPVLECLLLILIFELIREGGIRMPRSLGQAISIVGALIIGEAAVQAGVVSAPSLIVISATAICTFVVPKLDYAMLVVRLATLIAANCIGFLGITLAFFFFFIQMCRIKSFGVPYLSPVTPVSGLDFPNVFVRLPVWSVLRKSEAITRKYIQNEGAGKKA